MRVICPRCETRCAENDIYCPSCGASLAGATLEQGSDTPGDRRQDGSDSASHGPAPRTSSEEPPTASSRAPSETDSDFIPLRFQTANEDWRGGRGRRWLLLGIGLIVLLAVGSAVALLRDGDGDGDGSVDTPAIVADPLAASPTASGPVVVVASPSPPPQGAVSTPVQAGAQALPPATPATSFQPDVASTPTTTAEESTPGEPVVTASIAEGARLQTAALIEFVRPAGQGSSPEGPTPGDGTGGGIVTPGGSDVPLIGPFDPDATSQAPGQ